MPNRLALHEAAATDTRDGEELRGKATAQAAKAQRTGTTYSDDLCGPTAASGAKRANNRQIGSAAERAHSGIRLLACRLFFSVPIRLYGLARRVSDAERKGPKRYSSLLHISADCRMHCLFLDPAQERTAGRID